MRFWQLVLLALDGARRTPLRVALTALGVAIATGALVSMVAFAEGLHAQAEKPFRELDLLGRIEVSMPGREDSSPGASPSPSPASSSSPSPSPSPESARPAGPPPPLDDAAVVRLAAIPGVSIAYPEMIVPGLEVRHGTVTKRVFAMGQPREAAKLRFIADRVIAGRFFEAGKAPEVVLSRELAKDLGFAGPADAVGAKLSVRARGLVPALPLGFRFEDKTLEAPVAGVLDGPGWLGFADRGYLALPLDVVRELPGSRAPAALEQLARGEPASAEGYGSVIVRTERPTDAAGVEKTIQEMGYRTRTMATQMESLRTFFVVLDVLLGAVGTVALVVAGLGIVNTLLMAVLERYREIGAFKALGASDGDVRLLFLAEAGLVGLLGGAGGLVLGRGVSWVIGQGVNAYARSRGVDRPIPFFEFPWWLLLGAVVFAVLASVASGVYPASRAARVDPIRALRGE